MSLLLIISSAMAKKSSGTNCLVFITEMLELREFPGLAIVPKLKRENVDLTSFSKMRVDLAAQVY